MGGLSVSMAAEILSVYVANAALCGTLDVVSLCETLAGIHPETDCRAGFSPLHIAASFTTY